MTRYNSNGFAAVCNASGLLTVCQVVLLCSEEEAKITILLCTIYTVPAFLLYKQQELCCCLAFCPLDL